MPYNVEPKIKDLTTKERIALSPINQDIGLADKTAEKAAMDKARESEQLEGVLPTVQEKSEDQTPRDTVIKSVPVNKKRNNKAFMATAQVQENKIGRPRIVKK